MRKRGAIGLTLIFIQEVGGVVAGFFLSNSSKERGQTMLHVLHGGRIFHLVISSSLTDVALRQTQGAYAENG